MTEPTKNGLICVDTDYRILISKRLKEESSKRFYQDFFGRFEHQPIRIPKSYQPKKEFLEYRLKPIRQMKYGTLTNLVYAEDKGPEPKIGGGATLLCWSDRHAYTIVEIKKKYVLVTRDIAERTDRNFGNGPQEYTYKNDPDATPVRANLRKDGKYYIGNQDLKIGYRNEHYDYSF